MHALSRARNLTWIALLACVLLAVVPGPGLVICLQSNGDVDLGVGASSGCPCKPGTDGMHPPCVDVHLDGVRDNLPPDVPVPDLLPAAWLALAAATPLTELSLEEAARALPRAGPPPDEGPPSVRRALAARRAVVLLI